MKHKVKRYSEGDLVDGDDIPMDMEPRRAIKDYMTNPAKETEGGYTSPLKKSFKETFAEAVRDKKKTFEFGGKQYTTELASGKGSRSSKYDGVAKSSELDSSKKEDRSPSSAIPIALGGAGAAAVAAKMAMSKRGEGKKDSLAERVKAREGRSQSGSTVGKMPGTSLNDPYAMTLGGDLDPKRTLRGNKRMGMDSKDTEFKRGGQIKKMSSGGKTSSASKRADGCAVRGKTKGRML